MYWDCMLSKMRKRRFVNISAHESNRVTVVTPLSAHHDRKRVHSSIYVVHVYTDMMTHGIMFIRQRMVEIGEHNVNNHVRNKHSNYIGCFIFIKINCIIFLFDFCNTSSVDTIDRNEF